MVVKLSVDEWLAPMSCRFYLSGVPTFTPSVQPMQPFSAEAQPQGMGQARPLENETWWRMVRAWVGMGMNLH